MKRFFFGLGAGILLCGVAGTIIAPKIKDSSYQSGYQAGVKHGIDTGTAIGMEQGTAKVLNEQKRRHDSVTAAAHRKDEAIRKAAAVKKPVRVAPPQQNWHVIDGKIDAPVVADTSR